MRYHWIFLYSLPHLASPSWIAVQWPQGHLINSATVKRSDHITQIQARQTPRISGKTENCSSSCQMWNVFVLAAKGSNDEHIPWGSGPTHGQEFPTSCWGCVLGDVGEEATARTVCLGILFRKERKEEEAKFIQFCTRSENTDEVCEQISIHLDHSRFGLVIPYSPELNILPPRRRLCVCSRCLWIRCPVKMYSFTDAEWQVRVRVLQWLRSLQPRSFPRISTIFCLFKSSFFTRDILTGPNFCPTAFCLSLHICSS